MNIFHTTLLLCSVTLSQCFGQGILGKWKTIDDETGEPKSIVEIKKRNGKVFGKIIELFKSPGENPNPICDACPSDDARYKKRIIGMEILKNMTADGDELSGGNILDPEAGKVYRCRIWLEGKNLKVRGYWGPFYRTQTWRRFK